MIVISNTTPLIGLSILGQFPLLRTLFGQIRIPNAVYQEIVVVGRGLIGAAEVENHLREGWVVLETVIPSNLLTSLSVDLGAGEAEAIALALQHSAGIVLLDDRKARIKAQTLGLSVIGTVGLLDTAHRRGLVTDIGIALDTLKAHGFHIGDALYTQIRQHPPSK